MAWLDDLVLFLLFAALVWLVIFKRQLDQWLVEKLEKRRFSELRDPRENPTNHNRSFSLQQRAPAWAWW
jgi:hypothetical protein